MKRIFLVGGGSGGHAYPLLAVAQALQRQAIAQNQNIELLLLGEGDFVERVAREGNLRYKKIVAGKLRRYFDPRIILDMLKIPISFIQSFWYLFWFMPDVIFSKGGYPSVAPTIIGWIYFIPVYTHESDSVPGLANRIIAKIAKAVFLGFQSAEKYFPKNKTIFVGNPIRKELLESSKSEAIQFFNLRDDRKTLLILGGSQGAKQINDIILDSLVVLTKQYQIIHQSGENQYRAVQKEIDKLIVEGDQEYGTSLKENYRLYPFFDTKSLALAYALADCIVSRAGAGSLYEIAALGKPAVIIPLPNSAGNHQLLNAAEINKFGAAVVEGANMTPNILINQIQSMLEHAGEISQKIKKFATPDTAEVIASALMASE